MIDNLDDDQHKESIELIIANLKDERDSEVELINHKYSKIIQAEVEKFSGRQISGNSAVTLLEEKLKLEIISLVNDTMFPSQISK